jgi:hypothetical protein
MYRRLCHSCVDLLIHNVPQQDIIKKPWIALDKYEMAFGDS